MFAPRTKRPLSPPDETRDAVTPTDRSVKPRLAVGTAKSSPRKRGTGSPQQQESNATPPRGRAAAGDGGNGAGGAKGIGGADAKGVVAPDAKGSGVAGAQGGGPATTEDGGAANTHQVAVLVDKPGEGKRVVCFGDAVGVAYCARVMGTGKCFEDYTRQVVSRPYAPSFEVNA